MLYLNGFLFLFLLTLFIQFQPTTICSEASNVSIPSHTAVYAAIDFGSGTIKVQTSRVDKVKNEILGQPLLYNYESLFLMEDIALHEGFISEEMQNRAIKIINQFKSESIRLAMEAGYPSVVFSGIATAVFRKAPNGPAVLAKIIEETGVKFQILSQDKEGEFGYMTAHSIYPKTKIDDLIAWDSGSGSFQMTALINDEYKIFQGPLGQGSVRLMLAKEVRHSHQLSPNESGNPISQKEASELSRQIIIRIPESPEWLKSMLANSSTMVATFGDGESIFFLTALAIQALEGHDKSSPLDDAVLTEESVQKVVNHYIDKKDEDFISDGLNYKTLTSAIQLLTVMKHFNIQSIHYRRTLGSTSGMLITPYLWQST